MSLSQRRFQDMSSRRLQNTSSRRLQDVFNVTFFCLTRRLGRRNVVTLKTCSRRLQDQQMFAGMYSLVSVNGKENKGVNKHVVKNIKHKESVDVLFNREVVRYRMKRIQSKLHSMGIYGSLQDFFVLF